MLRHALFMAIISFAVCAQAKADDGPGSTPTLGFKLIKTYPHDSSHYTEGLVLHDGKLLESSGGYGNSGLYEIEIATGNTLRSRKVEPQFFAEGIALAHNRIVQLTWREHTAFVYDLAFKPLGSLSYDMEGWGLASFNHDKELALSDGTSTLRFIDASDYHALRQVRVHDGDKEILRVNELEEANGLIYANVWLSDNIAVIDPADGHVIAWIDLSSLSTMLPKPSNWDNVDNVLNGIAYNPKNKHFYVTGKRWPKLFEIAIDPLPGGH